MTRAAPQHASGSRGHRCSRPAPAAPRRPPAQGARTRTRRTTPNTHSTTRGDTGNGSTWTQRCANWASLGLACTGNCQHGVWWNRMLPGPAWQGRGLGLLLSWGVSGCHPGYTSVLGGRRARGHAAWRCPATPVHKTQYKCLQRAVARPWAWTLNLPGHLLMYAFAGRAVARGQLHDRRVPAQLHGGHHEEPRPVGGWVQQRGLRGSRGQHG